MINRLMTRCNVQIKRAQLAALLISLSLLCQVGCQEADSQLERFETAAPSAQLTGVDLGKYDQATAIALWQLRESGDEVLLEGLNVDQERVFGAIMDREPQREELKISVLGDTSCQLTANLETMALVRSTCTELEIERLGMAAEQLLGTLDPLLSEAEAGKADGLFSKIACVGAGVGASILSLIVWHFVSGVAIAGASVSTTVPILTASSSVIGAVALCYNAFAGESELGSCVSDCDEDLMCAELCIDRAKQSQVELQGAERATIAASQLLQCVGGCEGEERCAERCQTLISEL